MFNTSYSTCPLGKKKSVVLHLKVSVQNERSEKWNTYFYCALQKLQIIHKQGWFSTPAPIFYCTKQCRRNYMGSVIAKLCLNFASSMY